MRSFFMKPLTTRLYEDDPRGGIRHSARRFPSVGRGGCKKRLDTPIGLRYYSDMGRHATGRKGVKIVRFGIYLSDGDLKALRHAAVDEGRSATDIIRQLVRGYLTKRAKRKAVR